MTILELKEIIDDLSKIDTKISKKLITQEATTHNLEEIKKYISSYYRNR